MFKKVLVANRGEIACRIIRSCRKLGVETVAVYSEADSNALHVQMADEAYLIGPAPATESYLNMGTIVQVAKLSGAEAVHPGYGFLSENPAFAVACRDAGIKFIGPAPEVMETMGDKIKARELAVNAGLPVIAGTNTEVTDRRAMKMAKKLGFPLMVKAASGGGGIGMQIARTPKELKPIIERGRHLAESAFGSTSLYFERYLEHASHIEVQILADEKGKVLHLWERDCSVQRRNQKVVEVAPSIKLNSKQRKAITGYAVKLAQRIGYTNAGTVEFLVSREGDISFLEINKRLQVEHGITEMITGMDLVEMQLRIASGEALTIKQKEIKARGFAIEARIYAEDPETFMPSAGKITVLREPETSEFVRMDSCLYQGYEVSIYYDPLLAKLMCWGETREEARGRLVKALEELRIEGVNTNIPLLLRIANSGEFISGLYDTWLLSNLMALAKEPTVTVQSKVATDHKELVAAVAVAVLAGGNAARVPSQGSSYQGASPWKLHGRLEQMASRNVWRKG